MADFIEGRTPKRGRREALHKTAEADRQLLWKVSWVSGQAQMKGQAIDPKEEEQLAAIVGNRNTAELEISCEKLFFQ